MGSKTCKSLWSSLKTGLGASDGLDFPSSTYSCFLSTPKTEMEHDPSMLRRGPAMTLEEAERQMNNRGTGPQLRASSKLGALAAKGKLLTTDNFLVPEP